MDCANGLYCECAACDVSPGTCNVQLDDLQPCSDNDACKSGDCETTSLGTRHCRPTAGFPLGFECNEDIDCDSTVGYCDCTACDVSSGTCAALLADLSDCSDSDSCQSKDCETTGLVGDRQVVRNE